MNQNQILKTEHLKTYTYEEYRSIVEQLLELDMSTGENHSEDMLNYTRINVSRMRRLEKTAKLNQELCFALATTQPQKWMVLVEGWCGDAAQSLPWIAEMANASDKIDLHILFRDKNLDTMDQFLTNGGRSIPKLIALNEQDEVVFTWGPRPQKLQDIRTEMLEQNQSKEEINKAIHTWYPKNKGQELQREFLELINANVLV